MILLLYYFAAFAYAIFVAALFRGTGNMARVLGGFLWFIFQQTGMAVKDDDSFTVHNLASLLPPNALSFGMTVAGFYEQIGYGAKWSNITWDYNNYDVQSMLGLLFLDFLIMMILGIYLDQIMVSKFGIAKRWYFPFQLSTWCKVNRERVRVDNIPPMQNFIPGTIEDVDHTLQQQERRGECMQIRDLKKVYGSGTVAVDGFDLTLYKNQITSLLGHNGAGKTTTISMICGMIPSTEGQIYYENVELQSDFENMRKRMGVCPQYDVLFFELTVEQHLKMFSAFKGVHRNQRMESVNQIIQDLDLEEKRHVPAKLLSGGQRRKLSMAIAFVGNSEIVLLDEPTEGLDLTARRLVWDRLKNYKQDRLVILTTHYMEEADILGDRIAIMSHGKLRCCGSSLFLKNNFGVGYTVTFEKESQDCLKKVGEVIKSHVQNWQIDVDNDQEVSFNIPIDQSSKFQEMFNEIDRKKSELGVKSYGVAVTTLEQVFLRLAKGEAEANSSKRQRS